MNALKPASILCGGLETEVAVRWQHVKFDNLGLPEKPRVLQFGLHNRMDCVVYKPENNIP